MQSSNIETKVCGWLDIFIIAVTVKIQEKKQ